MTEELNKSEVAAVKDEANAPQTPSGEIDIHNISKKQKIWKILVQIALYAFLTIMAVIVLFPFYWMLISSLKTVTEYEATVPTFWPTELQWSNYSYAFRSFTCNNCGHIFYNPIAPTVCSECGLTGAEFKAEFGRELFQSVGLNLGRLFLNTVLVGVVSTILSLIITILSAYAFARLNFKGKNLVFALLLATMMIPGELFTVTNYVTVANWNLLNTYTVLIITSLVSVFYIYLLRQNFMQIPNELYLAAKVDGTSDLKYLWKVMIPLSAPTLISITLLKMMGAWNAYMWPKLVANDVAHRLITVGLRGEAFYDDILQKTNMPAQMAAIVIVTVPLLILFIFFRKYIMRGVSRSGIKG